MTKLYLFKLPHRISSPSSCISGTACLEGILLATLIREFGVALEELEVNQ